MNMLHLVDNHSVDNSSSRKPLLAYLLLVVAAVYVVVSLYLIFNTRSRLVALQAAQQTSVEQLGHRQDFLENRQAMAETSFRASSEDTAERLGMAERDLRQRMQARTAELQRQQQTFATRQQEQQEQIGQVSGEVANVRTELGGAKTYIAATRTDLESTKAKLERAIGDLTGQGTLIARTREDLEELKHRGDRNYYDFTLYKGARPTAVSTVSLQLKKVNPSKNKFTLYVMADDRTIEKKDRGVAEPLQFYTGRDRLLYEVVIFTTDKNKVDGYLSTPKSQAAPVSRASSPQSASAMP